MCTVIKVGQMPKKARKDIPVYKYCYRIDVSSVSSPIIKYIYEEGVVYASEFTYEAEESCSDMKELHYKERLRKSGKAVIYVRDGFHAYTSLKRANETSWDTYLYLFEFVIPKGTMYYRNGSNCIVAEKIYLKEAKCV